MTSAIKEIILFCLSFHRYIVIIGQDQSSLLNHCLSTQRRPHARLCGVPRSLLSFGNNNPFYHKQSLLPIHNRLLLEDNRLLLENNSLLPLLLLSGQNTTCRAINAVILGYMIYLPLTSVVAKLYTSYGGMQSCRDAIAVTKLIRRITRQRILYSIWPWSMCYTVNYHINYHVCGRY